MRGEPSILTSNNESDDDDPGSEARARSFRERYCAYICVSVGLGVLDALGSMLAGVVDGRDIVKCKEIE